MAERCRRLAGVWLLAVGLIPAPGAAAQGLSPQVDRDSPAGIEYQLPVERARQQAAGVLAAAARTTDRVPLFGVGVSPAASGTPRTSAAGGKSKDSRATPGASSVGTATPESVQAQAPPPDGAGRVLLATSAVAASVLLLGAFAGLGWRRRALRR